MCERPHTSNMVGIVDRPLTTLLSSRPPLFAPLPSDAVCRMHHVRSPARHHDLSFVRELFRLALFRDGVQCGVRVDARNACRASRFHYSNRGIVNPMKPSFLACPGDPSQLIRRPCLHHILPVYLPTVTRRSPAIKSRA